MITAKFGGSSVASGSQIEKVMKIVREDPQRRYIVVSAPGRRQRLDIKVTDLLYRAYEEYRKNREYEDVITLVEQRFAEIAADLNVSVDVREEMKIIRQNMDLGQDYVASRGEYLSAKITAAALGFPFVDAADCVFFERGKLDELKTYDALADRLGDLEHAVLPGFYGRDEKGRIRTFSRGGSDITGALVARATSSELYENWTDVNGLLCADPRIVENPETMTSVSYDELRELSYMGATVLHEEAVFPCRRAGIPIYIRNTDHPEQPGTMITAEKQKDRMVLGIAGKKGFSNIQIEKALMNAEVGFGAKVMQVLANHHVAFEHLPTSVDTMSILVSSAAIKFEREELVEELVMAVHPDIVTIEDNLALVAVVGAGFGRVGFAASLLNAVAEAGVNVRCIDAGFSGMSLIIGVDEEEFELCIRSLYEAMIQRRNRIS